MSLSQIFKPHDYQKRAVQKIIEDKRCGLFLDMGLGKTVITLSAINILMYRELAISKVLVIAPLRIAETTWATEAEKWEHTKNLKISKVLGSVSKRENALRAEADIYIINRENVSWLCNELSGKGQWDFDMVVIDELSSFKSSKSQRFRALRKHIFKSSRVIGLTGTPAPNGLLDLWSELYLLDGGERLGRTLTEYTAKYFNAKQITYTGVKKYYAKETSEELITKKISDICMSMKAEDWLTMPDRIDNLCYVEFTDKEYKEYQKFEQERYLEIVEEAERTNSAEISALSAAALTSKLLQYCNGAVYDEEKNYHAVCDTKLDRMEELIEEIGDHPILCFYSFRSDIARIKARFKHARELKGEEDIRDWNKGKIKLLLAHPASAGHGLNLQYGGNNIVWFGLNWSLELYQQANARLYRQGQDKPVFVHHLIAKNTIDETVISALQGKREVQDTLIEALKVKYSDLRRKVV